MNKVKTYLQKNIKTASLKELAEMLGYSEVHTGKLMKKYFGKPFSKELRSMRCTAARMLIETEKPIMKSMINSLLHICLNRKKN